MDMTAPLSPSARSMGSALAFSLGRREERATSLRGAPVLPKGQDDLKNQPFFVCERNRLWLAPRCTRSIRVVKETDGRGNAVGRVR